MLDRIIGGYVAELLLYVVIWGILLPLSLLLATPVIVVRALLHVSTFFKTLAHDYRERCRWWLGHFPFQGTPRVPAEPDDSMSSGGTCTESDTKR